MDPIASLKFDSNGLIPAIMQDHATGRVLMFAWMNADAVRLTIETGKAHFYSRSRAKMWLKGETSGHIQYVKSIQVDCDADVLLVQIDQTGAACHEGYRSCFFRTLDGNEWTVSEDQIVDPKKVYGK